MNSETIYEIILSVLSDEASPEERRLLSAWLEESDRHKEEFEKIKHLYSLSLSSEKKYMFDVEQAWGKVHSLTIGKEKSFTLYTFIRYAAVVALLLSAGAFYYHTSRSASPTCSDPVTENFEEPTLLLENGKQIALHHESFSMKDKEVVIKNEADQKLIYQPKQPDRKESVEKNRIVIPKGKTYQVILADGTKVWLNSETELTYPTQFCGDKREVSLSGEAFFEVARDENRPFYVKTHGLEVKVLGTVFNVSCYKNDATIRTTLVEGSVSIEPEQGETRILTPCEQFSLEKESGKTDVQVVDTWLYTSWVKGRYIFKDVPLEEIITKLQRWYDFSVSYAEEDLKYKHFSLTADRKTDLNQLIEIISFTSEVKLERIGNSINIKKEEEKNMP